MMSPEIPDSLEFVSGPDIAFGSMERLFDDVVRYSDPDEYKHDACVEEEDTDDMHRVSMGVIDHEQDNRLIAFASATVRCDHATVDCLVVSPLERGQGVGMALAAKGIEVLEGIGAKAISFVIEHESIRSLIPKLIGEHGFIYDDNESEYIRKTSEDEQLFVPADFTLDSIERKKPEDETEPIGRDERIAFKKQVCDLVIMAIQHLENDAPGESMQGFSFINGSLEYNITEFINDNGDLEWQVHVFKDERVSESSRGLRLTTGQAYIVVEPNDCDEPSDSFTLELWHELENPIEAWYYEEGEFTKGQYTKIMQKLNKLSVDNLKLYDYTVPECSHIVRN